MDSDKRKNEVRLVSSLRDRDWHITDSDVLKRIKGDLREGLNLDDVKKNLHVPILLLHECAETAVNKVLSDEYKTKLTTMHLDIAKRYMQKQESQLKDAVWAYQDICFHLILFPVPEKANIMQSFFTTERSEERCVGKECVSTCKYR